jgi:hypothetical protein
MNKLSSFLSQPSPNKIDWPRYVLPGITIYFLLRPDQSPVAQNIERHITESLGKTATATMVVPASLLTCALMGLICYVLYRNILFEFIRYAEERLLGLETHEYARRIVSSVHDTGTRDDFDIEAIISSYFRNKKVINQETIRLNSVMHGMFLSSILWMVERVVQTVVTSDASRLLWLPIPILIFVLTFCFDSKITEKRVLIELKKDGGKSFQAYVKNLVQS